MVPLSRVQVAQYVFHSASPSNMKISAFMGTKSEMLDFDLDTGCLLFIFLTKINCMKIEFESVETRGAVESSGTLPRQDRAIIRLSSTTFSLSE